MSHLRFFHLKKPGNPARRSEIMVVTDIVPIATFVSKCLFCFFENRDCCKKSSMLHIGKIISAIF